MDTNIIDMDKIYSPSKKIVSREIDGEIIIIPIEDGFADLNDAIFSFNKTGCLIWEKLCSGNTPRQISEHLAKKYDSPLETIEKDILELIKELYDKKIIIKG